MPVEMVFATILISFITCISCIAAGVVLILMVTQYSAYIKKQTKQELPSSIINRGYLLASLSIATGLFFAYRIFYVLTHNADFESKDWLLYDCATGIYMFLMSLFLMSLYKQRKHMDSSTTPPEPDAPK